MGLKKNLKGHKYAAVTIINNVIVFGFQICLIFIFN